MTPGWVILEWHCSVVLRVCDGKQPIGAAKLSKCNAVRDDLWVIHQNKKDIAFSESRVVDSHSVEGRWIWADMSCWFRDAGLD